ncbi:alpha alpha-trehalose-phosphate synthase [Tripterygium wilfordii]|uniref:Alpha alpha-trehalose-phosphate synthase n=1 Tax=Tripterygium wilfordii TaxID=458696 RepID=A0A7J7DT47_TRIWF|nr:probable alpha,alpha-trehalose-phosphate synthase [UDP-forming] 11 [Tripterygium wilfordii]KAF5749459.1 alpha alpha-trehalose-phosphate synthase [Tripterygium wilfordii]
MLLKSCMDSLNFSSDDDFQALDRISRLMKVPQRITESEFEADSVSNPKRRIIVANELPLIATYDGERKKWDFRYNEDSLGLQLKDGFPDDVEVRYVGCVKAVIDPEEQDEVSQFLQDNFGCYPVFLKPRIQHEFYDGFCKHYLWPMFHSLLPMSHSQNMAYKREQWMAYVSVNMDFTRKVMEVMDGEHDFVWVHDYHLMLLPTFLRKDYNRVKLGFFLHSPFPSSEIYKTIPMREYVLRGLLNCDLVGFHTFDYARHFLSCCRRILGIDYESKRGYIGLDYYGRNVTIKILPAGIHMRQLHSALSSDITVELARQLKERFEGKIVMVGVDDLDIFKGITLKFEAMGNLLDRFPKLRGKVVLVQIVNPARSAGQDVDDMRTEAFGIAKQINDKYGKAGYEPIVFINGNYSTVEKAAYYAIADCCVLNAIRDGMNLVPYKYTVCRQGSPALDKALGIDEASAASRKSVLIVSEFVGCSPSLSGAIRVNPWNIEAVADAMHQAVTMKDNEKHLRHEKHYKYISSHDITYWARSFHQDLEKACAEHDSKRCWSMGLGLSFRVISLPPEFRRLKEHTIVEAYKKTDSRLILLDYDGTMMPGDFVDKTPGKNVISVLNSLCSDPKNLVFIVSGRGKDTLSKWFSQCEGLGISAEHGYFTRWNKHSPWESSSISTDLQWKKVVVPVMQIYTERTDGSFIEEKESAVVWHIQDADGDFGSWQANELLNHLENVLANEPVVVKSGKEIVEVKPQGVSKGLVVEKLISALNSTGKAPNFLLCIGDDRSDEEMFETVYNSVTSHSLPANAEVYACTIGQKPSKAKYFVDDTDEVLKILDSLTNNSRGLKPANLLENNVCK